MRALKTCTVVAIAILLAAMPSFAEQRGGGGGGSASRPSGGSPPAGRAVPAGRLILGLGILGRHIPDQATQVTAGRITVTAATTGTRTTTDIRTATAYPYYYGYPGFSFSLGFGYPYGYAYPYAYGYYPWYGSPAYGSPAYGSPAYRLSPAYASPGSVAVAPGRGYGGVRIVVEQRDAQVFVDGYYVGVVDDFDEGSQQANLEPGPHRIEIRYDGFEPVTFDVNIQPGQTVTYRMRLRPSAR